MKKILIIDDDPSVLAMYRKYFTRKGYEVLLAEDGKEGLEIFREHLSCVLITDIYMPEKDGFEVILEARKINPNAKIVAISGGAFDYPGGFSTKNALHVAQLFGAVKVYQKPIDMEEVFTVVESFSQNLSA